MRPMTGDDAMFAEADTHAAVAREGRDAVPEAPSLERLSEVLADIRRRSPCLPVLAIRWMHLKHPLDPVQEQLIGDNGTWSRQPAERREGWRGWIDLTLARRIGYGLLYALHLSCRLMALRVALHGQLGSLRRQQFDLIAKTCCFGLGRPLGDRDFYYGDLQQRLAERGVRMLLLCGNVLGGSWTTFGKAHIATAPIARLPELCLVHPLVPMQLAWQQLRACIQLRRLAVRAPDRLSRRVSWLASEDCFSSSTTMAGLGFWIGRAAVRLWRPKAFVTFYEGHAWEHCLRWGAKCADAGCQTAGYQHTMVFRESHALTAPPKDLAGRSLPDVVLCLGEASLELMQPGHARYPVRLLRFGSFRCRTAAADRPADPARRTVLVTPEGIASEVQALFTFAAACARHMPLYTFVLRCHPEVPMAKALALISVDLRQQPNVILSEHNNIEEDFARSSALLYRGSTAVLYAILEGLLPINLHCETMRDRDPLFDLQAWRRHCTTPAEVAALLEQDAVSPHEWRQAEWEMAADYVMSCTGPVGDDRVETFLRAVGFRGGSR